MYWVNRISCLSITHVTTSHCDRDGVEAFLRLEMFKSFHRFRWFRLPRSVSGAFVDRKRAGLKPGAPNENIVQNHLNIALLNVF